MLNIVQEIVAAMLKRMYLSFFSSGLTENEKDFIHALHSFDHLGLGVEIAGEGKIALVWQSALGVPLGCEVTEEGFKFSEVKIYNHQRKCLIPDSSFDFKDEVKVKAEIKDIKDICMAFSSHVKVYFK